MKRQHTLFYLLVPVLCLLLSMTLIVSHRGLPMDPRPPRLERLTGSERVRSQATEALLLAEGESPLLSTVQETLDEMRVGWTVSDGLDAEALSNARMVLVCAPELETLTGESAVQLIRWVEDGGLLGLMTAPGMDGWMQIVGRKLGLVDYAAEYYNYHALRTSPEAMAVFSDITFDDDLDD